MTDCEKCLLIYVTSLYDNLRLYVHIEAVKLIVLNTMHQASANHKLLPKGKSSVRDLKLSIIGVIGCIAANHRIPSGIVSMGANPELIKGKIKRGKSSPLDPSTDFEIIPHSTAIRVTVIFINKRSAMAKSQAANPACGLKPRMRAVNIITVVEITPLTTPAPI